MYAIKVYLNKPKKHQVVDKNYYLMKDLDDNIVHVYTRKARAVQMATYLQEENPRMQIEVTENIPAPALARALKKKQETEHGKNKATESSSKSG